MAVAPGVGLFEPTPHAGREAGEQRLDVGRGAVGGRRRPGRGTHRGVGGADQAVAAQAHHPGLGHVCPGHPACQWLGPVRRHAGRTRRTAVVGRRLRGLGAVAAERPRGRPRPGAAPLARPGRRGRCLSGRWAPASAARSLRAAAPRAAGRGRRPAARPVGSPRVPARAAGSAGGEAGWPGVGPGSRRPVRGESLREPGRQRDRRPFGGRLLGGGERGSRPAAREAHRAGGAAPAGWLGAAHAGRQWGAHPVGPRRRRRGGRPRHRHGHARGQAPRPLALRRRDRHAGDLVGRGSAGGSVIVAVTPLPGELSRWTRMPVPGRQVPRHVMAEVFGRGVGEALRPGQPASRPRGRRRSCPARCR